MIHLKTQEEIEIMREGGRRLRNVVKKLMSSIRVGATTKEIDRKAESLIRKYNGEPSFKKVPGYHWSICIPINEQIVHTPPSKRRLKGGDIVTVDIGMFYKGFHTDCADTVVVGENNDSSVFRFLEVGKKALYKAIDQAKLGNRIGHISQTIEREIYGNRYKIVKELTGHGIGRELHEDPYVFGFLNAPIERTVPIRSGLVIAIEVIYSIGAERFVYETGSEWSVVTKDRSLSACFEHTVAVTDKETVVLT
jgi:methionyl aminopeptidase